MSFQITLETMDIHDGDLVDINLKHAPMDRGEAITLEAVRLRFPNGNILSVWADGRLHIE